MKPSDRPTAEGILLTDQYQLTMAQLYFKMGLHERFAQFDHFFRSYPNYGSHQAGYCINAGLEWLLDWMREAHFRDQDVEYLRGQTGRTGERIFDDDFLAWLRGNGVLDGMTMRAIPEGRVVHPNVPLTVVQGPLAMAQILETSLLNHLNYPTLIATKAARIHESGRGRLLLEFGLRRAQERGANAGARAALIGGADFTSNVGISHVLGYPPKGTHAHSMVQVFMALGEGELGAFRAYADVYPDDCLLLVDTIDTLESGIPNAIKVFEELRRKGHEPVGIRLDSGDLAHLSIQAAKMLNQAGFPDALIVLSNQLDELVIWQAITQIEAEAARYGVDPDHLIGRLVYGVGTRLITSRRAHPRSTASTSWWPCRTRVGGYPPSSSQRRRRRRSTRAISTSGACMTGGARPRLISSVSMMRIRAGWNISCYITPRNTPRTERSSGMTSRKSNRSWWMY